MVPYGNSMITKIDQIFCNFPKNTFMIDFKEDFRSLLKNGKLIHKNRFYKGTKEFRRMTSIVNDRNGQNRFRPKPKFRSTLPKFRPKFRPKLAPNFSPILAKNCHQKLLLSKIQMTSYIFWSMKLIHVYLIYHCFITKMNQKLYWNFKIGKLWRKLPNRVI